ncbi:hypothetical protein [Clostridium weizhouense]|uniref:Uncharacterized protein n=1 Tax=Clostridium weizhouense TaxID=2859781 RepID=A0ABS7ASN1_9CLOT|nr:hypothetical protein [Clostridium weizhouense]MBW6411680.1 hypothetical protein [Clostridium weizhouense]
MKCFQDNDKVIDSWRRCIKSGLQSNIDSPSIIVNVSELKNKINKNLLSTIIFDIDIKKIKKFIPKEYAFMLLDSSGILIKKK